MVFPGYGGSGLYVSSPQFCQMTWSCGSRQRDTTSNEWKFQLYNSAVKGLTL